MSLQVDELVTLVWCLDSLGHQDHGLYEAVARRMVECIQERESSSSSSGDGHVSSGGSRGGLGCGSISAGSSSSGRCAGSASSNNDVLKQQRQGQQQQQEEGMIGQGLACGLAGGGEVGYSAGVGLEVGVQGGEGLAAWQSAGLTKKSYDVLGQYDPFLCIMVLYRDFFGGAWSLG